MKMEDMSVIIELFPIFKRTDPYKPQNTIYLPWIHCRS